MQHTKEPWFYSETDDGFAEITNDERAAGEYISIAEVPTGFSGKIGAEQEANARRIVACVNACAGISTETLEAMPAGPSAIERQREQLLAATQYAIARYPDLATDVGMIEALRGFKILCLVPQQN